MTSRSSSACGRSAWPVNQRRKKRLQIAQRFRAKRLVLAREKPISDLRQSTDPLKPLKLGVTPRSRVGLCFEALIWR
jgi:hypothetical protein